MFVTAVTAPAVRLGLTGIVLIFLFSSCRRMESSDVEMQQLLLLSEDATTTSASTSVKSIAKLRAVSGTALPSSSNCNDGTTANQACCLLVHGHTDHSDGGGGVFCYKPSSATADDGGTVIKPTSVSGNGRWHRYMTGAFNVRWFGAKGNGTNDDRASIQSAVDAAVVNAGSVHLPPGTYRVQTAPTKSWAIKLSSNVHVSGAGFSSKVILADNQPAFSRVLSNDPGIAVSNIHVSDLQIDGNRANQPADTTNQDHGVFLTACSNCVLTRLWIHDAKGDAIILAPSTGVNQGCIVSNNVVHDNGRTGINVYGASHTTVSSNTAFNLNTWAFKMEQDPGSTFAPTGVTFTGNTAYNVAGGLSISGTSDARTVGVTITGNSFSVTSIQGTSAHCFGARSAEHIVLSGNTCKGGLNAGFNFDSDISDVTIAANTIKDVSGTGNIAGIFIGGGALKPHHNLTITGNLLVNDVWGIFVANTGTTPYLPSRLQISGNTFRDNAAGVVLADAKDVAISSNVFSSTVSGSYGVFFVAGAFPTGTSGAVLSSNIFAGHAGGSGIRYGQWSTATDLILNGNSFVRETSPVSAHPGYGPSGNVEMSANVGYKGPATGQHVSRNATGVCSFTAAGAATSFDCAFPVPEADTNYRIVFTPTGTPVDSSKGRIRGIAKAVDKVTLTVDTALSSGDQVVYDWILLRDPT